MWFALGGVCPVLVWGPLLGSEARPPKSEKGRAGHKSKSGATLAVDRGRRVLARRVCRSHEGNGVNMTEKGPVRAYGVRAVCTGTSTPPSAYELNVICTWGL